MLHSLARTRERGRPVSGTVRSSWSYLAKLLGELLAWERAAMASRLAVAG